MRTTRPKDGPIVSFLTAAGLLIMIALFGAILATGLGWQPPQVFAPSSDEPQPMATVQVVRPQPQVQQPVQAPAPAVVPTAYIPVEHVTQYEPAPPASVPVEEVQPRTEIVNVQRAPEQTTIIRTVPQNPSGPPIVVDGGVKRRGVPKP